MAKGGNVAVAAPRVSAPVGGPKAGPAVSVRTPEMGPGASVATQFSSRGLEAFRNPGPQVSIKGSDGPAVAKMRIDSFGKSVSTPSAKTEFSKPGVTSPQRNENAYAPSSDFSKSPEQTTPKATITTQLQPVPESNASQGSSFRPVTAGDMQRFTQEASQIAQRVLGNTLPAGTEVKGQVEVRNNTVKIVSIDKPKAPASDVVQAADATAAKKVEPTVSQRAETKSPDTSSPAKPETHLEPFQVAPGTELSGDTTGNLSEQDVKNLVQQPAYTGEAKPVDTTPAEMKNSVRRLPDIATKKAETPAEKAPAAPIQKDVQDTVKEPEAVADRKELVNQEPQQVEQREVADQVTARPAKKLEVNTQPSVAAKTNTQGSATVPVKSDSQTSEPEVKAVSERKTEIKQELQQIEQQQTAEQAPVQTVSVASKPVEPITDVTKPPIVKDSKTEPAEPVGTSPATTVQQTNKDAAVSAPPVEESVAAVQPVTETKPVNVKPIAVENTDIAEQNDSQEATQIAQHAPVAQGAKQITPSQEEAPVTQHATVTQEAKTEVLAPQEKEDSVKSPQEVATAPINPAEKAPEIIAETPVEDKAVQVREERSVAFQQELQRIKEQVAALAETAPVESGSTHTTEAITVLPDAKPLPVQDIVDQPQTSGAEFGNLLKKRQKAKLTPLSVSTPDEQTQIADKTEAVTVKVRKNNFLKGFLQVKVSAAAKRAKEKARSAAGYVSNSSAVIDWEELLGKKKKKSAYEEITGKTGVVDAILEAQHVTTVQEAGKSVPGQPTSIPQPVQFPTERVTVAQPVNQSVVKEMIAQQQEAVVAQVSPNTQPVATPEQVQELHSQAEQVPSENFGTAGIVIFAAGKKDDPLKLILDKEAKQARQNALENGVRNARRTPEGTLTGADVVAASPEKHTGPLLSGAAQVLGIQEDGSEITLWNNVSTIEELLPQEMIARALEEENNVRPVAIGENGSRADERDLALVLSNVQKREELGLAA